MYIKESAQTNNHEGKGIVNSIYELDNNKVLYDSDGRGFITGGFIIPDKWKQDTVPIILCHGRSDFIGGMEFYCVYCHKIHYHGRGNGHRTAHCNKVQQKRWSNKNIPVNSPYTATGYYIVLAYPYDYQKEKEFSIKPKITINTRGIWSSVWVDIECIGRELTDDGLKALEVYMDRYNATHSARCGFASWGNGGICFDARIRKELRFHVAQEFLDIATNPTYTTPRTYDCMICGMSHTITNIGENMLRMFEMAICDNCNTKVGW